MSRDVLYLLIVTKENLFLVVLVNFLGKEI